MHRRRQRRGDVLLAALVALGSAHCGARTDLDLAAQGGGGGSSEQRDPCDGVDNDGDGQIDEDAPLVSCGLGACRVEQSSCADGQPAVCEPGAPSAEVCNGVDDDCDGAVDEDLPFGPLADPIVIWDSGPELAIRNGVVQTSEGFLVVLARAFGEPGAPTLASLRLDASGAPLELPQTIDDVSIATNGPRLAKADDGTVGVAYCGVQDFDSRAFAVRLDERGESIGSDVVRQPADRSCGAMDPAIAWLDGHWVTAWNDNEDIDGQVLVDVSDASLGTVSSAELERWGDLSSPPRLARNGDTFALVAGLANRDISSASQQLGVWFFDDPAGPYGEPVELPIPDPSIDTFADPQIVPTSYGFLVVAGSRFEHGLFRARLSLSGEVLEPLDYIPGADAEFYQPLELEARPTGGAIAGVYTSFSDQDGLTLFVLDDAGNVTHTWRDTDPAVGWPTSIVTLEDGRVGVVYPQALSAEQWQLRFRLFGCVDP